MLVRRPTLAILDEATSALDLRTEAAMYAALAALPGITYLSVGHRPSLERFHRSRLRLLGTEPSQANGRSGPSPSYKIIATEKLRRMREVKRRRSEARRRRSDAAHASSAP